MLILIFIYIEKNIIYIEKNIIYTEKNYLYRKTLFIQKNIIYTEKYYLYRKTLFIQKNIIYTEKYYIYIYTEKRFCFHIYNFYMLYYVCTRGVGSKFCVFCKHWEYKMWSGMKLDVCFDS